MLNLVTGKQRSGKSYCVVSMMIDYLRSCNRDIYTNLPVNPDLLCHVACGGRLRNPALYKSYLLRMHVFTSFSGRNRANFRVFRVKNPDFVKLYHSTFNRRLVSKNLLIPCGVDNAMIRQFWRYTESNSIVFLDEVYEIFGALDQLKNGREARKEMLSYAKQHGHFKDDLYLITHDPADIDKIIRKSLNKQYVIQNSKYKNIFEHRLFKGLRWPVQFFIVKGYEYGERQAQDQYNVFPKQAVFACYNSFNVSDFLAKHQAEEGACSSDTQIDHKANFQNFFKQAFPLFLLLFSVVVGFFVLMYVGYHYFASASSPAGDQGQKSVSAGDSGGGGSELDSPSVILVTPRSVCFSDGSKLVKGGIYNGFKIEKITRDFLFASRGGRGYRFSLSDFRGSPSGSGKTSGRGNTGSDTGNGAGKPASTGGQTGNSAARQGGSQTGTGKSY